MDIAVFLPNWLGDVVMSTPVLRSMREHFGSDAHIVGIMRPYLREVLGGTDWLDQQWFFHPKSKEPELRRAALIERMRRKRFDLAVLLPNSFSSAVTVWRGRVRERVGYARDGRGPLLTKRIIPRRHGALPWSRLVDEPMVDHYIRLAEAVGCPAPSRQLELRATEEDDRAADMIWDNLGLRDDGRVITLNSSGAYGGAKLWPVEHFAALAGRLVEQLDHDVLVMCGPNEREIARDVVKQSGSPRVFSMADQPLGIGAAKACMARGRLMVSTDSGPRHIAAALGKPLVTVFGPMLSVWSENPTQRATNLHLDIDCIGCHKRVCPLGHHRCMRDLSVDRVYQAVVGLLEEESKDVNVYFTRTSRGNIPQVLQCLETQPEQEIEHLDADRMHPKKEYVISAESELKLP
ncbi:MAG: lipopolysaccharide heptosyltransferase II [Planctomycetota bacterium]|nr:lipopolysaccharide heptosyltransferase II [Planctomycetota bacterium]